MTKKKTDNGAPVPSQDDEPISVPHAFVNELLVGMLDQFMERLMARHLLACSLRGCVEPTVAVLDHSDGREPMRLCKLHLSGALRGIRSVDSLHRQAQRAAAEEREFAKLDPAMQYALDGR